jgi:hypothetical protein
VKIATGVGYRQKLTGLCFQLIARDLREHNRVSDQDNFSRIILKADADRRGG